MLIIWILLLGLLFVSGQETIELTGNNLMVSSYDLFGDYFVVSSLTGGENGGGVVYVYNQTRPLEWDLMVTFDESLVFDDHYGYKVEIEDDYFAVSAPGQQRVYLYRLVGGEWSLYQTLAPSIQYLNGQFGIDISLNDRRVAIGHPGKKFVTYFNVGAVDLYYNLGHGWARIQSLLPLEYFENLNFGETVDLYNDQVLIGSKIERKAYTFNFNNGTSSWFQSGIISDASLPFNFAKELDKTDNFLMVVSEGLLQVYRAFDRMKIFEIEEHVIHNASITDEYLVYRNNNDMGFVYKFMYNRDWRLVHVYSGVKDIKLIGDKIITKNGLDRFTIYTNIFWEDLPTSAPTRNPTQSPQVPTQSPVLIQTPPPTEGEIPEGVLYAGIIIPSILLLVGMFVAYQYAQNLKKIMKNSPEYNFDYRIKHQF